MLPPEDELDMIDHEIAALRAEIDRSDRSPLERRVTDVDRWRAAQRERGDRLAKLEQERETLVALVHDDEERAA